MCISSDFMIPIELVSIGTYNLACPLRIPIQCGKIINLIIFPIEVGMGQNLLPCESTSINHLCYQLGTKRPGEYPHSTAENVEVTSCDGRDFPALKTWNNRKVKFQSLGNRWRSETSGRLGTVVTGTAMGFSIGFSFWIYKP